MKTFRTLDLAVEFYKMVEGLKLPPHLKDQILRAASSISLNLSEGNSRFSFKDKKRLFQIAFGSLRETQTVLKLGRIEDPAIVAASDRLGACMYKLLLCKEPGEKNERGTPSSVPNSDRNSDQNSDQNSEC